LRLAAIWIEDLSSYLRQTLEKRMNRFKVWTSPILLTGVSLLLGASLQATTTLLFEGASDLERWTVTNSTSADVVVVDTEEATQPVSQLDGDAIRIFDIDGSGRSTFRYLPDEGNFDGMQLSFEAWISPEATENVLVRIGNDGIGMAGIKGSGYSLSLGGDGNIVPEVANPEGGGWKPNDVVGVVEQGTVFSVSLVLNTSEAAPLTFPYGEEDLTLAPQTWALFIDDILVATDLAGLNAESTNDGTYRYVPADGAFDIWWLSGSSTPAEGIDFQFDNIAVRTGADIGVAASSGGGDGSYAGFDLIDGTFVDTGDWMGFLYVADAPWLFSYSLNAWVFMDEPAADAPGAWVYVPR
jgi:hypothetical protein